MSDRLPSGVLSIVERNHGGVHPSQRKNTAAQEETSLPTPASVKIPMQMHIGAPCTPVVKVGEHVEVGQVIADSEAAVSAPIHASISGKVKSITEIRSPADGRLMSAIEITADEEQKMWSGIKPPEISSREDFFKAVRASGLVGLGGAGFPAHFKLNIKPPQKADILIANGAECEPYITVDDYCMRTYTKDMLDGIAACLKWTGIERSVIGVEDNKPEAISAIVKMLQAEREAYQGIQVMVLPAGYPKGAEKVLIQNVTGRHVPVGKLPADAGCVVMNVTSLAVLGKFLRTGEPLTNKLLTIDGGAIKEPKNVRVPIGTRIGDVMDFCGGFKQDPAIIMMGGPMMGTALSSPDYVVLKNNNALLALVREDFILEPEQECIRCAKCIDSCPMLLQPISLMRAVAAGNAEKTAELGVMNCMECGCCSYTCSAHIPLVQYIRHGKKLVRALGGKK